jgi:hypothetical protein
MKAGTYYIGDLCYVMHKEWDEVETSTSLWLGQWDEVETSTSLWLGL